VIRRLGWAAALAMPLSAYAQQADGQVAGVVFEHGSGAPLAGLVLRVGDASGVTDAAGRFVLSVQPGTWSVSVTGTDGVTRPAGSVRVEAGKASELLITWDTSLASLPSTNEVPAEQVAPTVDEASRPRTTLAGTITSDGDGTPVRGARVFVRGRSDEAVTDAEGRFSIELPVGSWELSIVASAFAAQSVPDVVLAEGAPTQVSIVLVPAGLALEDFTVRAPKVTGNTAALLDERRESSVVADVLGAEQMSRSGDSSAASALRRVTGLTLVDGKYVYVRGLGERYSMTIVNGAQLPSPEPERRVVPLDMFPASVLESVVVQKTFSPDMPGEFGGGIVLLRTLAFPTGRVVKVSLSSLVRGGTTFQEGLVYERGPTDFLGVDNGTRAEPAAVVAASEESPLKEKDRFSTTGYTAEELQTLGREFQNVWTPHGKVVAPDVGLNITLGNGFKLGGRPVGALLAFSYGNEWQSDQYAHHYFDVSQGEPIENTFYDFTQTNNRIRMSGLLTLGAKPAEGQEISATTMLLRNTDDESRVFQGNYADDGYDIKVSRIRWIERMLIVQQVQGSHELGTGEHPTKLDWRYEFARASRLEPDRRENRYDWDANAGAFRLSSRDGDSNSRFFSTLGDDTHEAALNVTVPFLVRKDAEGRVKVGASIIDKSRSVDTRRFSFLNKGDKNSDALQAEAEQIFTQDAIAPDGFQIKEITQATDNYFAGQRVIAGYALAEVPVTPWFEVMAGLRVERSTQQVTTFELFNPDGKPIVSDLATTDVLPAVTLTFKPRDDMDVRAGYGRTLSRPEFRELSPASYVDVTGGRPNFGNPELKRALIDNIDLRWEWFPDRGDVVSVSGFAKLFTNPIENLVIIGSDEALTYTNALRATNLGLEFEVRKGFEFASPALRDLYVAANAALIRSRVELDDTNAGAQTNNIRPLQGQSPWVVNAQIGYDNPDLGINAAILYNVFGPRISEVGSFGLPDSREMPFHALDVVFGAKIAKGFDVKLSGKNLLDSKRTFTLGEEVIESRRPGWSLGLELGWKL
jgi:outer membrane receptor protein involved in Fe transport